MGKTLNFLPTGVYSGKYELPEDFLKNYRAALNQTSDSPEPNQTFPSDAVPSGTPSNEEILSNWDTLYPKYKQALLDTAQIQSELNRQSYADAYPWLSAAAREAKQLDYGLTQKMLGYKETLPTAVQARAASMQAEKQAASSAFAQELQAMADVNRSAALFAGQGLYRPYAG